MWNRKPSKINCSLLKLESLRETDGFINLTTLLPFDASSREPIGNQNRIKNWIQIEDTIFLVKGEIKLEDIPNYGVYAELIVEEMGKMFGIPMAHYDLIKLEKEEITTLGVLSKIMFNPKEEELVSLHDLIGEEKKGAFLDATEYDFTIKGLEKALTDLGYTTNQINDVLLAYQKRLAFYILLIEADKHIENISFLKKEKNITLSPNYDSEASLLLDTDQITISHILNDFHALKEIVNITQPRIGTIKSIEEGGLSSFWMDTLEVLLENDEVYNYCTEVLAKKIDMDLVFSNIEKRIKAPLPENVKLLAKYAYEIRYHNFLRLLKGEI